MANPKTTKLRFPAEVGLRSRATNVRVAGELWPLEQADVQAWVGWRYAVGDEDAEWNWEQISKQAQASRGRIECYALRVEDVLEGLAAFDLRGHATCDGRALVIDYVASNPKNRRGTAAIGLIGFGFLALAIKRSMEQGWEGRVWLESLPGAESFYTGLGFRKLQGLSKDGYAMFELTGDGLAEFIRTAQTKNVAAFWE